MTREKQYFDQLLELLQKEIGLSRSQLTTIAFSVTAVKYLVRPGYLFETAELLTVRKPELQSKLYNLLVEFDPDLYYYNRKEVGILVASRDVTSQIKGDQFFQNLGTILGFNYNIADLKKFHQQYQNSEVATLSYSYYQPQTKTPVKSVFYTEILILDDYLLKAGQKSQPFQKQLEQFQCFGRQLGLVVTQEIEITISEDNVMRLFYEPQIFPKLKQYLEQVANYFYNESFEHIGEIICDKIINTKNALDFFDSNEYRMGLIIYYLFSELETDSTEYQRYDQCTQQITRDLIRILVQDEPVSETRLAKIVIRRLHQYGFN